MRLFREAATEEADVRPTLLGVVTLLYVAPLGLALAHQALAIVVLTIAVMHAERINPGGTGA